MPNPTPDPFAESSDYRKVMREAKIGILMLVMLVGFFMYVVYYRVERFKSQLPQYVLDAPVANLVEPDQYFHQLQSQVAEAKQPVASNKLITASGMIPPMVEKPVKRTAEQPLREKEITVSMPEKKRSGGFSSFLSAIPFGNSEKGKSKKSDSENKQVDSKPEPIEYPVVVASANTPIELPKVTTPHRLERPMQKPKSPNQNRKRVQRKRNRIFNCANNSRHQLQGIVWQFPSRTTLRKSLPRSVSYTHLTLPTIYSV